MHLKSLVIKGLKTFADREELTFEARTGVTAVVGPNGCGKSNIVDSFRFALGEGNFRDLRVHALPEVIFAGTEARKPLSLAEVTLIFDNADHAVPIDYSEIAVRRRVFRSGESEFLINNSACRLKDIRDLFLDTGLSTESLSIMSQGNVDAVLSSKPEERRAVFEEVAGINKYKFRKLEAERKLILSEQNLLRISDLKIEVAEQAIALEAQARSAREYKEIQTKLKELELSTYKKQLKLLLERKDATSRELEALKAAAQETEARKRSMQNEKIEKMHLLRETEKQAEDKMAEITLLKDAIEAERGNLALERERHLFEEKNKLRDRKEEERFIGFEIKRLEDGVKALIAKKEEIDKKGREADNADLTAFGAFQDTIKLTLDLSRKLKEIVANQFGRTWQEPKEGASDRFRELLEAEAARTEEELIANKSDLAFKQREQERVKNELSVAQGKLTGLEEQTQAFLLSPQSSNVEKLSAEKNEKLKELDALRANKARLNDKIETLEKGTLISDAAPATAADLLRAEIAFARIEAELAQIETLAREEHGLSLDELMTYAVESTNVSRSKKEIEAARARLRELEPVNLLAIEEYDKCRERHSFIETQHSDLVLARENLKTLITELDLKAREDFINAMEVIARNFSAVFSELFNGGEARIIMESDKDALEAGIDISVRPPHRKWLSLSLLSGGERALTAIALLFAILKTSPSPLCILDEVDAALDDSNVERFASYLKKFSETSHILIITHNKRTMAVADTIYGVTMEEPGVSKIISMKFVKAA